MFAGFPTLRITDRFSRANTGRKRKALYFILMREESAMVKAPNIPAANPKRSVPATAYRYGARTNSRHM